jgi:hypothetical protein
MPKFRLAFLDRHGRQRGLAMTTVGFFGNLTGRADGETPRGIGSP